MKISRQDEAKLPQFDNHESARKYFKNKYGNDFMMMDSEVINGEKMYFYNLILDRKTFEDGQRKLLAAGSINNALEFMNSHQRIEIFENGNIHIIH